MLVQQRDLAPAQLSRDGHIAIGSPKITVPLGNLIVEDESITPNSRRHRAYQPMILMGVVRSRRKHQIGIRYDGRKGMYGVLDLVPMRREPPVRELVEGRLGIRQERPSRCLGLGTPLR